VSGYSSVVRQSFEFFGGHGLKRVQDIQGSATNRIVYYVVGYS
jgi:hypothetical protein